MTKETAIEQYGLIDTKADAIKAQTCIDDGKYVARRVANKLTGENVLPYDLVQIFTNALSAVITSGLGDNQITHYTRLDSYRKGYEGGVPDIELKCKLEHGSTDVVAIELQNLDQSNTSSIDQPYFLEKFGTYPYIYICQ